MNPCRQCEQMSSLIEQYLAINNSEKLPIGVKIAKVD